MSESMAANSAAQLLQMLTGKWISKTVSTVAALGIADQLDAGSNSIDDLAQQLAVEPDPLYRLMRAAASIGVFQEAGNRRFFNNELSSALRADSPTAMRDMAMFIGGRPTWDAWGDLEYSIRTGRSSFEHVNGKFAFPYMAEHPEMAQNFNRAMVAFSRQEIDAVFEVFDFSNIDLLCDVGGGEGGVLEMILQRYPQIRGLLFDQQQVIERAKENMHPSARQRCQFVAGDFFESVPAGADVYMMKHIMHDWSDRKAIRILRSVSAATPPGTRLIMFDNLIDSSSGPDFCKLLDVEMLVLYDGGRERTRQEYAGLLEEADFQLTRVTPTRSLLNVIEAERKN